MSYKKGDMIESIVKSQYLTPGNKYRVISISLGGEGNPLIVDDTGERNFFVLTAFKPYSEYLKEMRSEIINSILK